MKKLTVILVSLVLSFHVSGYLIKVPTAPAMQPMGTPTGYTQWVHLQKLMIPLFENVCETSSDPIIQRKAQEFSLDPADYLVAAVITNFQKHMSAGLLPKGAIFTEYDPDHMNELKIIYEILFNAKDFDTFYKAAAWARQNLNCALYVSAIYMAVQHRRDTEKLSIPAPYELLPNYFISKDVIVKASSIISGENIDPTDSIRYEGNSYTLDANYTALFYDNDDDSKLAYFREDIGLNSYYFLRKLKMAPWFNSNVNGGFGENLYQMMKQFMARYNLERYANGLPEIDGINWQSIADTLYDPMLIYSDGNEFGHRTAPLALPENEDLILLQTIENNIVAVVSHLRQSGYNKSQILNHLMEILVTSERSYETLARKLLGKDRTNNGHGSVLEHYMTSLRDPMFWQINKRIVDMIDEALKILPKYARNELYFPGVEVVNVDVKKMTTACDYFKFDVTEALSTEQNNSPFKVFIGQPRLNHKQFTIKVNISSLVPQKGMIKIYLGPKILPGELVTKKNLFTLLDIFEINLKKGSNIVTRSSDDMKQFSEDFMLIDTIRKKVEDAEFGLDSLPLKTIESQFGYPSRLILPKGTPQGLPLQIFVFVAPYVKASLGDSKNSMEFNTAMLSPGYPLDLMIEDRQLFELPNVMIKYITVAQKSDSKIENYGGPGVSKSWYATETYDPSSRPNYNSNNGQYGRNNDYLGKVNEYNIATNEIVSNDGTSNENYGVTGINGEPHLLMVPNFDFTSKKGSGKEPFDYKAKKAQYGTKDYPAKRDFTKYRTKPNVDGDIITTTSVVDAVSSLEHSIVDASDIRSNSITEEFYINKLHDDDSTSDEINQQYLLEVEPLPHPAMLLTDPEATEKVDYRVKKMERDYKMKARKIELDELIRDAKQKQNTKKLPIPSTSEDNVNDFKQDVSEVEALPLPAMLKKDPEENEKVDYRVKKMESDYKLKTRKIELDDLIRDAKQKQNIKNKPNKNNNESKKIDTKEKIGKVVLNKDTIKLDGQLSPLMPVNYDNGIIKSESLDVDHSKTIEEDSKDPKSNWDVTARIPTLYDYLLHALANQL